MSTIFLRLLLLLAMLLLPGRAAAQGRAPWAPGAPDPCSGIALPCAQLDDFNLTLRLAGTAAWPGPSYRYSAGGSLGLTLSLYKTVELGFLLPLAAEAGNTVQGIYGPPTIRLRLRAGPMRGPARRRRRTVGGP